MGADLGRLAEQFAELEAAGCNELHFDIMDGDFSPNLTLGPDFITMAKKACGLPCTAHLMVERPERYIDRFAAAGADTITLHLEGNVHVRRALDQVRSTGASAGIALNPATPLTKLDYILDQVERVLVMTVDPGYVGQALISTAFERVRILRQNLLHRELSVAIEVEGNIDVPNAATLANMGARHFVLGSASIFKGGAISPSQALDTFRRAVNDARHLV